MLWSWRLVACDVGIMLYVLFITMNLLVLGSNVGTTIAVAALGTYVDPPRVWCDPQAKLPYASSSVDCMVGFLLPYDPALQSLKGRVRYQTAHHFFISPSLPPLPPSGLSAHMHTPLRLQHSMGSGFIFDVLIVAPGLTMLQAWVSTVIIRSIHASITGGADAFVEHYLGG